MPLDPSIILANKPPDSPSLPQLVQLKEMIQQGAERRRQQQGQDTLGKLYASNTKPDGSIDTGAITQGLGTAGFGEQIPGVLEEAQKRQGVKISNDAAELELHKSRLQAVSQQLVSLISDPELNHSKVIAKISGLVDAGIIDPNMGEQMVKGLPGPNQLKSFLIQKGLETQDVFKQLEALTPKANNVDLGGEVSVGTTDPLTGRRIEASRLSKTATPGEKLTNQRLSSTGPSSLSGAAVDLAARRLLNGEPANKVLSNFGRGAQGARDIAAVQNRFAELAQLAGADPTEISLRTQELASESRARLELGSREGKIAPRVEEANQFAKIAKTASAAVPRGSFVPLSKLSQYTDAQLSDPALAKFKAANLSLINAYAAAVGGGTPTVNDKQHAEEILNTATSPEAYAATVDQLVTEMEAALASPGSVMGKMRDETKKHNQARDIQVPPEIDAILKRHDAQ